MVLDKALSGFYDFLRLDRHLSENTLDSYRRDIKKFSVYCGDKLFDVNEEVLSEYVNTLKSKGKATATVARNMVSLRSLYSYLKKSGAIKVNPAKNLEMPRVEKKLPMILTGDEVLMLLEQPDKAQIKGCRDKAMLELLYATGIKVSELINLNISNVNLRRRMLTCNMRVIPLGKEAVKAVSDYLKNSRSYMVGIKTENALFVNMNGGRLTRQGFWKIIKSYKEEAGIDKEITPHMLRHSFAAHLLENGADLVSISEMMGLTDIASTTVYKKIVENKIFDVYKKAHPRA